MAAARVDPGGRSSRDNQPDRAKKPLVGSG
jgi:hypothetical protein